MHVRTSSHDVPLHPLYLQEIGYTFNVQGVPKHLFGTLCLASADNLGSCALGGFKEGSTAHLGCRHCMTTPIEMKTQFKESCFELRTPDSHTEQCTTLNSRMGPSRAAYSKETGINHESVLDELQYFSVASGALLPDVMHDVLEGVLQYEAKLLLRHLIYDEGCFTLNQLNSRIGRMELGFMESSNRPSQISATTLHSQDNNLLTQNGWSMWPHWLRCYL